MMGSFVFLLSVSAMKGLKIFFFRVDLFLKALFKNLGAGRMSFVFTLI